jgi:hypothetical protein
MHQTSGYSRTSPGISGRSPQGRGHECSGLAGQSRRRPADILAWQNRAAPRLPVDLNRVLGARAKYN